MKLKEKLLLKKFKLSLMDALMEEIQKMLMFNSLIHVVSHKLSNLASQNGKRKYHKDGWN